MCLSTDITFVLGKGELIAVNMKEFDQNIHNVYFHCEKGRVTLLTRHLNTLMSRGEIP